jgi:hypothetical protein
LGLAPRLQHRPRLAAVGCILTPLCGLRNEARINHCC